MSTQLPPSLARLAAVNPIIADDTLGNAPEPQLALERILATRAPEDGRQGARSRSVRFPVGVSYLAPIVSVLVAVAIGVAFLSVRGSIRSGSRAGQGVQLVYRVEPGAGPAVTKASIARSVAEMRQRLKTLGLSPEVTIRSVGHDELSVGLPALRDVGRVEEALGSAERLEFFDWEANALTPDGKTVASQLPAGAASALAISQAGGGIPGGSTPAAGALGLYQAVRLASEQPYRSSPNNTRAGPEYYLFANPGSAACTTAASTGNQAPAAGVHCLLAGPVDVSDGTSRASAVHELEAGLTPVEISAGRVLTVKRGTVVLQAISARFAKRPAFGSLSVGYYVLRDQAALSGDAVTNPQQSTDPSGEPDVNFGFDASGKVSFEHVTAQIARRGELDSSGDEDLAQHFAVALDNQLITVPSIDFRTYPDGIPGGQGAEITGGFTTTSARSLASQLRLGELPIKLVRIAAGG